MSDLDVDKGPAVLTTIWALTSAACLFVFARLLVRLQILKKAGWDDLLITLSMLLGYAYAAVITIAVHSGYGKHVYLLSPDDLSTAKWYNIASFIPGLLSIVMPKLAVVALLVRTMNPSARQKYILWGMALGSGLLLMGCVAILYAQCKPTRSLWEFVPGARCWGPGVLVNYSMAVGGISAAVDAYLAIYPAVVIWKLHMSIKKKIGLSLALGLGAWYVRPLRGLLVYTNNTVPASWLLSNVLDSHRYTMLMIQLVRLPHSPPVKEELTKLDATADLFIWTSIEANTIIIAACVPTIAPLIEITLGKRILNTTDRDSESAGQLHPQAQGPEQRDQGQMATHQKRARAWLSSINVEQSYHQCSIQRTSWGNDSFEELDPSDEGIQRRDDVIIEYGKWPDK